MVTPEPSPVDHGPCDAPPWSGRFATASLPGGAGNLSGRDARRSHRLDTPGMGLEQSRGMKISVYQDQRLVVLASLGVARESFMVQTAGFRFSRWFESRVQDVHRNCDRWDSKVEPSLLDSSDLDAATELSGGCWEGAIREPRVYPYPSNGGTIWSHPEWRNQMNQWLQCFLRTEGRFDPPGHVGVMLIGATSA